VKHLLLEFLVAFFYSSNRAFAFCNFFCASIALCASHGASLWEGKRENLPERKPGTEENGEVCLASLSSNAQKAH